MFRRFRIAILLLILLIVALNTWTDGIYSTQWTAPMVVALFPINADGSNATEQYIAKLKPSDLETLEQFFTTESAAYGIKINPPLEFTLAPSLRTSPPIPPSNANIVQIMWWSLRLRWWGWSVPPKPPGPTPRIRLFLMYYNPVHHSALNHSTGLKKGLLGIAQLFADPRMSGSNDVVIAHELLHTLGATDKYERGNNLPRYPEGYAEPDRPSRYPQDYAELMAGRIPLTATTARTPDSLDEVVIGPVTATEIGWSK